MSLKIQTPYLGYFPLFTSFILCIFVIFRKRSQARTLILKSPPGPWKLPVIGNLHHMVGALPHHILADLAKKHGPIMHLKLGQLEAVIISSSKAAQEVLKTHERTFAQRPQVLAVEVMSYGQASVAFAPYGDVWRELGKICVSELLNPKRVQSFRSIREEEVRILVESIASVSRQGRLGFNFSEKCFEFTDGVVSRAAFGKKCKDQKEFTSLLEEAIKLAGGFDIPDLFPSLRFVGYLTGTIPAMIKLRDKIGKILENIVDDHKIKRSEVFSSTAGNDKAKEEGDFVDVLLNLQESNKLEFSFTVNQIKDVVMDVFSGGSVTSATTLGWAMSELMRNPRIMRKVQAEVRQVLQRKTTGRLEETDVQKMEYLKSVVKETLRLHPPSPLLPREARDTCRIGGYDLPTKSKVLVNEWALGRDQESWGVDAESFRPERFEGSSVDFRGFDFEFIPFGAGRRICPGISFATSMIELALCQLLCDFDWELANGIKPDELDMTETFGVTCRKRKDLYLIATPRFASLGKS